jgi:hypothetical protein
MSDGFIPSLLNTVRAGGGREARAVSVRIIDIPAALANQNTLSGEVTAIDGKKIEVKTPQGTVTLEADIALAVGQKINLRIITTAQRANTQMVTMLLEVVDNKAASETARATPSLTASAVAAARSGVALSPLATEYTPETAFAPDQIVNIKILRLPEPITREALARMIKEILSLSPDTPLPPALEEGLNKIRTLLPLVGAGMADAPTGRPVSLTPLVEQITRLIQTAGQSGVARGFIDSMPIQNAIVLDNIPPGIPLDGDIVATMRRKIDQVIAVLNAAQNPQVPQVEIPELSAPPAEGKLGKLWGQITANPAVANALSKIPADKIGAAVNALGQQIQTVIQPEKINQALSGLVARFDKPLVEPLVPGFALVLGQKAQVAMDGKNPAMLVLFRMDSEQSVALMTLTADKVISPRTVLPGSVVLLAMPQQSVDASSMSGDVQMALMQDPVVPLRVSLGDAWPALDELWGDVAVRGAMGADAAVMMRQTVPQLNAGQLPPTLLFFMSALRHGFADAWLGEGLRSKNPPPMTLAAINQLARDMQAIQTALNDPQSAESWRPLPMPLQVNDQMLRLQWHFRHHYDDPRSGDDTAVQKLRRKTRFLLDVPRTRLGDMQIDGLVQTRKLDVIVRTETLLASHMEIAMRNRFHKALETSGFSGGITFQSGRQHYVHV